MANRGSFLWLPRRWRQHSSEPGAQLFEGLRIRLTLWYCAVLGVALLLFSIGIYFGVQYFLLHPIEADAASNAHMRVQEWLTGSLDHACSPFGPQDQPGPPPDQEGYLPNEVALCFDAHGNLLSVDGVTQLPPAFIDNNLVQPALQAGEADNIVNAGGTTGHIYRYALAVPGHAGVVIMDETIEAQENALSVLLILLIALGGVSLIGAGLGGLFLAERAMAPASMAFTRQQQFIGDAAHELRTPLTLMRADAEVLLRGRTHMEAEDVALLEDIVSEANHMATMANRMLTLARLDAGGQHREYDVVNLGEIALKVLQRVQAFAEQKDVTIHLENSTNVFVIGDPALLEQALLVLIDNAIKYNRPAGQVTVRLSENAGKAQLQVSDTGIGIPPEHLPHLSERFYRVDKARSREVGGTGLGLSIAHGIAALHSGSMSITSTPDQGTTVKLQLPLAQNTSIDLPDHRPGSVSPLSERG